MTDTAASGKFCSGPGHTYRVQYLDDTIDGVLFGNGTLECTVPFGIFGGKNPKPNLTTIERPDGKVDEIVTNSFMKVSAGDIITLYGMGGASFGDPFERDTRRVQQDVRDGFVSLEKAREEYGVVIAPETYEVDEAKTAELRKAHKR